ncbi:hypothetical protein T4A_12076 [Trichinella pseudospiralis]|uniref:Uncharacterized protein n=1 Tax=Trichinella pseudospiralis TaxID=6337 RepID=A0A0V1EDL3_TRIPS|nr:hypothetical protein T4A_12076 [Trichinella pseudospiralis]
MVEPTTPTTLIRPKFALNSSNSSGGGSSSNKQQQQQ